MIRRKAVLAISALAGGLATWTALAQPPNTLARGRASPAVKPIVEGAHWHHLHINATDPDRSIEFYTTHFDAKEATFADGKEAVWTQKSWILFNKVPEPPSRKLNTAIWHMGWGTENPKAEYERQKAKGASFFAPLTDISIANGGQRDRFYYMYVEGPDRTLIELNTASHHHFGHIHLFSKDPIAAGDWYIRTFGLTGRPLSTAQTNRTPRFSTVGNQIGPSSSLYLDNINFIIYPVGYSRTAYRDDWKGVDELQSTRGKLYDHIAISVPKLEPALAALGKAGVKVTEPPKTWAGGRLRSAFIEGPDHIAIELIEDRAGHPPFTD
ncbi:MAG TPA: VOC family protein [Caulobacteraceae bacterium]|nr:VOC family protein [Caulobacteraceae bacterium]